MGLEWIVPHPHGMHKNVREGSIRMPSTICEVGESYSVHLMGNSETPIFDANYSTRGVFPQTGVPGRRVPLPRAEGFAFWHQSTPSDKGVGKSDGIQYILFCQLPQDVPYTIPWKKGHEFIVVPCCR